MLPWRSFLRLGVAIRFPPLCHPPVQQPQVPTSPNPQPRSHPPAQQHTRTQVSAAAPVLLLLAAAAAEDIGVFAEPEISITTLSAETPFLVVASDGLWEFISSQRAVDIVSGPHPAEAAQACMLPHLMTAAAAASQRPPGGTSMYAFSFVELSSYRRSTSVTIPTMPPRPWLPRPTSSGSRRRPEQTTSLW